MEVRETPWGKEELILGSDGADVTVKIVTVKPGHRLSLQRHSKREERWVVLSDKGGMITIGRTKHHADRGESHFIAQGELHRLSAPRDHELKILEAAFGKFDQNDIERLEDDYGRADASH